MSKKQSYYGRHNLPQKNKMSIASRINATYYYNLKKLGRSDEYIFNLIQPERRKQFFEDVLARYQPQGSAPYQRNWLQKLFNIAR